MGVDPTAASWEAARAAHAEAFVAARAAGDVEAMAAAALKLASVQRFGLPGGRTPALLHEAYIAAADLSVTRARVAAALARSWVYGNDAARGAPFALEAVELAETAADPTLLADALDAQLATSWGPDDLAERQDITRRLEDVAAYVDDERTRMDAHLWRLVTALETLDVVGVHRQLSALELLAEEIDSPVVRYFAMTRRAMHSILIDDLDRARSLVEESYVLGIEIDVADAFAVYHEQLGEISRHRADTELLAREAKLAEDYALAQGLQSLVAEAAVLWLEAGHVDRAAKLADQVAGKGFDVVPYDVDWALTVTKTTEAAAGCGLTDIANAGVALLAPYAGRSVLNAGAVVFEGIVDDYLWHGGAAIGDQRADDWRAAAAAAYRRLDAPWWQRRVSATPAAANSHAAHTPAAANTPGMPGQRRSVDLRPLPGGAVWSVGPTGAARLLPNMRGLHYLHALVQRPGAELSSLDLTALVAGHGAVTESDLGERIDRKALAAYRQRLRDIDEELDEAQSWADTARIERVEAERDALLRELAGATGLGGRLRTGGSSAERARVAVRKAIATALERIQSADPATARVLRRCIRTGSRCRYEPDPDAPIDWVI